MDKLKLPESIDVCLAMAHEDCWKGVDGVCSEFNFENFKKFRMLLNIYKRYKPQYDYSDYERVSKAYGDAFRDELND